MGIDYRVKRKLWASSGGYCAKPDCHSDLFPFFENGKITNIEELAHIIGKKEKGPRGNSSISESERDNFENIILLCPTCHTIIDKNPDLFSEDTIKNWKANHDKSVKDLFSVPKFDERSGARKHIKPYLEENKIIFKNYGPYSENAKNDQMATEVMWEKLAIEKILPNNRYIEKIIEANQHLLNKSEFTLFIEFKLHREGFEYNKISGDVNATVPRFPSEFENILK